MIEPKSIDLTKNFTTSGVKEIGNYTYVLLIDGGSPLTLIKRIKTDNSEIKFALRVSGTIDAFWATPAIHDYVWIHKL